MILRIASALLCVLSCTFAEARTVRVKTTVVHRHVATAAPVVGIRPLTGRERRTVRRALQLAPSLLGVR